MDRLGSRKQSEFGRRRGEEKLEAQALVTRILDGEPPPTTGGNLASKSRSVVKKKSPVHEAMERAQQQAKDEALRQQQMDVERQRLIDLFAQRVDACADDTASRDRRAKIVESTRRALRQVEELAKFLGLDRFDPILATVTSLRTEDPELDLDHAIETNLKPLGVKPAEYFHSSLQQLENLQNALKNSDDHLEETLEEEERMLYEDAATTSEAVRILARDCSCGARLDQAIESAQYAASIQCRLQLTSLFSKVTMGCTNMIRGMEKLMLEKERRIAELVVSNEILVERAEQSRHDFLIMERNTAKQVETLQKQLDSLLDSAAGSSSGGGGGSSSSSGALKDRRGSAVLMKGFMNDMNAVYIRQKEFFQRETMLISAMKSAMALQPTASSRDLLEQGLKTAFQRDPSVTDDDKKVNAPWVKKMLKRVQEYQQHRTALQQMECQIMATFDIQEPVPKLARGIQTMKEEDVPGSPAWEKKYAALREAAAQSMRPVSQQTMNVKEVVSQELVVRSEMRRCGFEYALGLPKRVTAGVENVLGCAKELMLNLDYSRMAAMTKFTALLEEQGGSKVKAVDLGNSLQAAIEAEVDDQLDHFRKALNNLKTAVVDELKPVYVEVPSSSGKAESKGARLANSGSLLYKDLLSDITKKITAVFSAQQIMFQWTPMEANEDPVLAQIRSLDAIVDSVPRPSNHRQKMKKKIILGSDSSASYLDGDNGGNEDEDGADADKTLSQVGIMTSLVVVDIADFLNNLRSTISIKWGNEMQEALGNAQPVSEPSWNDVVTQLRQTSEWCKLASTSLSRFRVEQNAAAAAAATAIVPDSDMTTTRGKSTVGAKKSAARLSPTGEVPGSKVQISSGNDFDDIPVVLETKSAPKSSRNPSPPKAVGPAAAKGGKQQHKKEGKGTPGHGVKEVDRAALTPPAEAAPTAADQAAERTTHDVVAATITLAGMIRQVMFRITNVIATKGQIVCPLPEEVMEEAIRLESQYDPDDPPSMHSLADALDVLRKITGWSDFLSEVLDPSLYHQPPPPPEPPKPSTPPPVAHATAETRKRSTPATPNVQTPLSATVVVTTPQAASKPLVIETDEIPRPQLEQPTIVDSEPEDEAQIVETRKEESGGGVSGGAVKPPTRGTPVFSKSKPQKSLSKEAQGSDQAVKPSQRSAKRAPIEPPTAVLSETPAPVARAASTPPQPSTPSAPVVKQTKMDSSFHDEPASTAPFVPSRSRSTRRVGEGQADFSGNVEAAASQPSLRPVLIEPDVEESRPATSSPLLIRRSSSLKLLSTASSFVSSTHTDTSAFAQPHDDDDGDDEAAEVAVMSSVVKLYPSLSQRLLAPPIIDNLVTELQMNRRRSSTRLAAPKLSSELCLVLIDALQLRDDEVNAELRSDTNPAELLSATLAAVRQRQETRGTILPADSFGCGAENEIHRLEMMLRAAESTVGELLFEKMTREGKNEDEVLVAVNSAKKLFASAAQDPMHQADLRRVQTPPVGSPVSFRKLSHGESLLPPRPEHGLSVFQSEGLLGGIPSQAAVAQALKGLESVVESRRSSTAFETLTSQSVINKAMRKLSADLGPLEKSALLNELIGSTAVELHRAIMQLLTRQVFRRIKLKGAYSLADPLADAKMTVPNIPELLKHDLSVISSTLELMEEDSKHAVEKMKVVFQRVQANILFARVRRAQEKLLAQTQGVVRDVQADLLRRREEKIRSDLQRLTALREQIRGKQKRNWNLDSRSILSCAKIGIASPHSVQELLQAKLQTRSDSETEYMSLFLARMDRWFQYKRASVKKPTPQLLDRIREANQSPSRRTAASTPPPPELQMKVFTPSVNLDVGRELSRRAQGSLIAKQKQHSTLKKVHPALLSSPIVSDRQRDQIEKVLSLQAQGSQDASLTPPCSPWAEAGVQRHTQLPSIGSPPPTRQTSRISNNTSNAGGSSASV